ncbi:MAG: aspartate kinase [Thermoanaerobaculia bacterium]
MKPTILKFGGTSVGSAAALSATVGAVVAAAGDGPVVVVVSALARVTDELDRSIATAVAGEPEWRSVLRSLHRRHLELLAAVAAGRAAATAADALDRESARLRDLLHGCQLLGEASPGVRARILAAGERCSAPVVAAALTARGAPAAVFDGTELLVVEGDDEDGEPDLAATRLRACGKLPARDPIPVVTGFFGADGAGRLKLLGRGGSDTSATVLGAALGAARIEIWTDVDGIFDRDPALDEAAVRLPRLAYDDAEALARSGARVLHVKAIAPARSAGVPIVVRNTFRPDAPGSRIDGAPESVCYADF